MTDCDKTIRQVAEMPLIKFVCKRDWTRGPDSYVIGFFWNRNSEAQPGEPIYRKWLLWHTDLRFQFRTWFEYHAPN